MTREEILRGLDTADCDGAPIRFRDHVESTERSGLRATVINVEKDGSFEVGISGLFLFAQQPRQWRKVAE